MSMGRPPMAHPPGMATRAIPVRAMSGPSTRELARMVFTISYLATGSESVRQRMVVEFGASAGLDLCAHGREQPPLGGDVPDLGNVFESNFVFGENRRRHAGQRRVFGP
jgi:hypothetical protein